MRLSFLFRKVTNDLYPTMAAGILVTAERDEYASMIKFRSLSGLLEMETDAL